jgi:hypothetical protein
MPTATRTTYDRRAIMADAIAQARTARASLALTWTEALGIALHTAWAMARRRADNLLAARPERTVNAFEVGRRRLGHTSRAMPLFSTFPISLRVMSRIR